MALCPFADKRWLIPPPSSDPRITPRIAILHSDGGDNYNLGPYFDGGSGGIESHFHIAKDGHLFQYRDTDWQADANYLANDFALSIETQGTGYDLWTPEQIVTMLRLLRWMNEVHGIPLRKVDRWDGSGIGFHIQFGSPGKWTNVGKICPGPKRIEQYETVVLPALAGEEVEVEVTAAEVWSHKVRLGPDSKDTEPAWLTMRRAKDSAMSAKKYAVEALGHAKRAEAVGIANSQKLDMLIDRSLSDEERAAAVKQIADDLAQQLARIDIVVTAEVRAVEEEQA